MNSFSIEELDREEIEFLPARVVMTACNPRCTPPPCYVPKCAPQCAPTWCPPQNCAPVITVCADVRVGCLLTAKVGIGL